MHFIRMNILHYFTWSSPLCKWYQLVVNFTILNGENSMLTTLPMSHAVSYINTCLKELCLKKQMKRIGFFTVYFTHDFSSFIKSSQPPLHSGCPSPIWSRQEKLFFIEAMKSLSFVGWDNAPQISSRKI